MQKLGNWNGFNAIEIRLDPRHGEQLDDDIRSVAAQLVGTLRIRRSGHAREARMVGAINSPGREENMQRERERERASIE